MVYKIMTIARIKAMAAAVPNEQISMYDLGFDAQTVERTIKLTGCSSVRYAPKDKTPLDYCLASCQELFSKTDVDRESIDGIIFVTPHQDYIRPGNTGLIQSKLGLSKRCIVFDVTHSCTGMIYGLYLADLLVRSGDCHNVLVCCGDTVSHHLNSRDRALRMVVGDGGVGAVVSEGGNAGSCFSFCHDGEGWKYLCIPAGGERMPICPGKTDIEKVDADGNYRTLEEEYMDGMEVMRFVMKEIPPLVDEVLQKAGWNKDDLNVISMHQANDYIVKTLARHLKVPKNKVLVDIDGNGNIGGASAVMALCHANVDAHEPWKKVLMASFGAGMSGAAMTADLSKTRILPVLEI